jgi:hypothetical protein
MAPATRAQDCGTLSPTDEEYAFTRDVLAHMDVSALRNEGTTCIPLQAHVVCTSAGTDCMTQAELNRALAFVNYAFMPAGIEFFWKGPMETANNSDLFDYDESEDSEGGLTSLFTPATDAVNIYFPNSLGDLCGWAYYPPGPNVIVMSSTCALTGPAGTFPHEMGHYLGLYHTFEGTENGPASSNAENVARTGPQADCTVDGDLLCGTAADPRGNTNVECEYVDGEVDVFGVPYDPPLENIMSYYPCSSWNGFTDDQFTRTQQGLLLRLSYLNAPPMNVAAPGGLTATLDSLGAHLEWTDNADNELGYLIERSTTSATEGFRQVAYGSTAADDIDYNDHTLLSNTTYYFRVKTVNGDCNAYSNVDSVTTGIIYCTPFYLFICGSSPIDDVVLIGETSTLSNLNSGCSSNEYGNFTSMSTDVNAGGTYSLQVGPPDTVSYVLRYIQVWGDWNQDGDFNDVDETMLPTYSEMAPVFHGSLTIPVGAMGGSTRMRIRVWNQSSGGGITPCGQRLYGEGEDYTLVVNPLSTSSSDIRTEEGMALFPNPTTDLLQVSFSANLVPAGIEILDAQGRLLRTVAANGVQKLLLDVSELSPGVHVVRSRSRHVTSVRRFTKL